MLPENGKSRINVPPDLEWPVTTYTCSMDEQHSPDCSGLASEGNENGCEELIWTELQVRLENLRREYARNEMSQVGIPTGVPLPISGIQVDLVDLLCRILTLEELAFEAHGIDREEYDEKYRENKFEFLNEILKANKERVRKAHAQRMLGLPEKRILGPGGEPIG